MAETETIRPKLLLYSDSPTFPTGLARVTQALIKDLHKDYEIAVLGWGYRGLKHEFPVKVYQCPKHTEADAGHMLRMCQDFEPDILLCVGDPWDFIHVPQVVTQLRRDGMALRWYYVALVDGHPLMREWLPVISQPDGLAVTSEYGHKAIQQLDNRFDPPVFRLGVDTDFWKVEEPRELLVNVDGPTGQRRMMRDDTFFIFWSGVNTGRKNLGALQQICAPFLQDHDDAYLFCHICYDTPNGHDVLKIQIYEDVPAAQASIGVPQGGQQGVPDAALLHYYAIATVVPCVSVGEGNWLPGYEAQACGCIPIGPDFSATPETIGRDGSRGILVPCAYYGYGENMMLRGFVDQEKFRDALEDLYQDWKSGGQHIAKMREAGRRWARFHSWERFTGKVREMMGQPVEAHMPTAAKPAADRPWVLDKVDLDTLKVAMLCPTFTKNCGIGEYSRGLIGAMEHLGLHPLQFETPEPELAAEAAHLRGVSLLHIQHEFSFYQPHEKVESALRTLSGRGIAAVITLHSVPVDIGLIGPLLEQAAAVLVHSERQVEECRDLVSGANIIQIPMGAPAGVRLANREKLRALQGYTPGDFVIGSYGFLRDQKGYDVLLNALTLLPENVKLMIFASEHEFGSSEYDERFMEICEQYGTDRIRLVRERLSTKAEICNLLQMADVLALVCRDVPGMGLSSAVKDCAAAKRPLLVSDSRVFDDLPETIDVLGKQVEACVRVPQNNHEAVAEVVKDLMEDPERMKRLANAAATWAWRHRWVIVAEAHAEIYQAVLEGREPCLDESS